MSFVAGFLLNFAAAVGLHHQGYGSRPLFQNAAPTNYYTTGTYETLMETSVGRLRVSQSHENVIDTWGADYSELNASQFRSRLPFGSIFRDTDPLSQSEWASADLYEVCYVGWPILSFQGWTVVNKPEATLPLEDNYLTIPEMFSFGIYFSMPAHPMWIGLLVNTIFYSVTFWLLTYGVIYGLKTRTRKRRLSAGLCPQCAYDLRGCGADHTVCPECGATT